LSIENGIIPTFAAMLDKLTELTEFNTYSTGTKFVFLLLLLISPAINGIGLLLQHDFILVLVELILLGYVLPLWIMHKKIDEMISLKITAKDIGTDAKDKAKAAIVYGIIVGAIIGAILIVWSKFIPIGPSYIILEMPLFKTRGYEIFYWVIFALLWVLVLPVAEVALYFMFQACVWTQAGTDFLIAGVYALMNWSWLVHVVGSSLWALIFAGVAFFLGYIFLKVRDAKGGIQVMGIRIGIAIGVLAYLIFLNYVYPNTKVPVFYFRADLRNVLTGRSQ
jgi:hypothetical protein